MARVRTCQAHRASGTNTDQSAPDAFTVPWCHKATCRKAGTRPRKERDGRFLGTVDSAFNRSSRGIAGPGPGVRGQGGEAPGEPRSTAPRKPSATEAAVDVAEKEGMPRDGP